MSSLTLGTVSRSPTQPLFRASRYGALVATIRDPSVYLNRHLLVSASSTSIEVLPRTDW